VHEPDGTRQALIDDGSPFLRLELPEAHNAFAKSNREVHPRSNEEVRELLGKVAQALTPAQLEGLNAAGVLPEGLNLHSLGF
jgi:hypothetical protein